MVTGRYELLAEATTDRGMAGLYEFLNHALLETGDSASSEVFVVMKAARKWSSLLCGLVRARLERRSG